MGPVPSADPAPATKRAPEAASVWVSTAVSAMTPKSSAANPEGMFNMLEKAILRRICDLAEQLKI